jgi:hypothetical protein
MKHVFYIKRKPVFWIPIFPFLLFWLISFSTYYFGPVSYQGLSFYGFSFIIGCLFLFFLSYVVALNIKFDYQIRDWTSSKSFLRLLKFSGVMVFLGSSLLIIDRMVYGSSDLGVVLNEMYRVRSEFSKSTTFLTTLSVIPYSFKLVFVSCLFYAVGNGIKLSKAIIFSFFFMVAVDILNMFFSANRGAIYEYFFFILYYLVLVKKYNLKDFIVINKVSVTLVVLSLVAFSYFFFVASSRTVSSTLEYQGSVGSERIRWEFLDKNMTDLQKGAFLQLYDYFNHGLEYTDVLLPHSPLVEFDFVQLLGVRFVSQISRFFPNYETRSSVLRKEILYQSGKSIYGWPSVFGISATALGIVGSLVFFPIIGFLTGAIVKKYVVSNSLPYFILVTAFYSCYLLSFDWFLRDFTFYISAAVFLYLILQSKSR